MEMGQTRSESDEHLISAYKSLFSRLHASIFLFTSVARPLNEAKPASGSSVTKGIEILLDDLSLASALGGIKTGGPSSGGNGHAFVDAVTNSGPSSGGGGH
ncbi:hypothetical protein GQ457_06G026850 [Hibiscus cannabinus]